MAQKTIPELQEILSPPIDTTFLACDDGVQTFKLALGELLRRPKNYRPTMTITPSVAAAITTFEHILKVEALNDEDGLAWWMVDINVQFAIATSTQTGFTIAFAGLLFEAFAEQPGVLAVTPSGGTPVVYTAGTSLYCKPNTNILEAKHPSTSVQRYGVQGRFMLKDKPTFASSTEFLVLDGAGNPTAGGGLTNVAINTTGTITANTFEECDSSAASITRTLPPLPLGGVGQKGITVVLLDAARAASDTKDIVLAPAAGQRLNIPGLVADDTISINVPGGWVGAYAAPGDTSWKIQTQASTIGPQPGLMPGYVGSTPIAAGMVGEKRAFTQRAAFGVGANAWGANASPLDTLTPGVWLIFPEATLVNAAAVSTAYFAICTNSAADGTGAVHTSSGIVMSSIATSAQGWSVPAPVGYLIVPPGTTQALYAKSYGEDNNITINVSGQAVRIA